MAGQLPLEQFVVVRIHCPQHKKNSLTLGSFFIALVDEPL